MKFVDEYRRPEHGQSLLNEICQTATQPWTLMEVCGGQTHGLLRYGIDTALDGVVRLIHGPGCPVCVTPLESIDLAIELARRLDVTVTSFGDMLRVPGSHESLLQARAEGGNVHIVYSPLDAVRFAEQHPDRQVVFFAVGFETTAPATALAVHQAGELGLTNFSLLVSHVRVQPAMEMLADCEDNTVQGFLAAGHVCTVAGYNSYERFAEKYRLPVVVTGFEPVDLLLGIQECVRQLECGEASVVNCYSRSVAAPGNERALAIMDDVYEICDRPWRGLGVVPNGGFRLRSKWARFDADRLFARRSVPVHECSDCRSGDVLTGRIKPTECAHSARAARRTRRSAPPWSRRKGPARPITDILQQMAKLPQSEMAMAATITSLNCPVTNITATDRVMLAHGEGGRLMRQLIHRRIMPAVDNEFLRIGGDAALLPKLCGSIAMTTDSFVVSPLFFPGGDIGSLAVYGTVNDLAVAGAQPRWISLALILEEGLEIGVLERVLASVAAAAKRVGVFIVAGDTKVVPRGAADQLFINTTGVGEVVAVPPAGPQALEVGDELIVTGPIARHGIAVMAAREGLQFDPLPQSDSAPLVDAVAGLQHATVPIRALRDATRGGLGAVLHEWAEASEMTLAIEERLLPVLPEVRAICELLGLDPIHVANEGTMVVAVPKEQANRAIDVLRQVSETAQATYIGRVEPRGLAAVAVERGTGQQIPLDEPIGAPLPRIC